MRVKMILPSLLEAGSPGRRPIKYSLFPPLGLATLAGHLPPDWPVTLVDQHVEKLHLHDEPDLVMIEVYITNAKRAYSIADHYRSQGAMVLLGGLHVTSLPDEAEAHGDVIFLGPADQSFPKFLEDLKKGDVKKRYSGSQRDIYGIPPLRRDLIQRHRYLVPNSLVVSRGCPHHCRFCYKDAFYEGGRSFYTQQVDEALGEIERLPGRHLYFLDDHLLGHPTFATSLFEGMKGMGRLFQGASTVDAILRGDLIERAVDAGLRSIFVGFESVNPESLGMARKTQNFGNRSEKAIARLHDLGVRINGSFVFGLDGDSPDVFERTVEWGIAQGLTTSTYHIATPYPGTPYFKEIESQNRLLHRDWERYDTRQAVFQPKNMTTSQLEEGYWQAYRDFYSWSSIWESSSKHTEFSEQARHFAYAVGWKKMEPLWNFLVQSGALPKARRVLEGVLDSTLKKGKQLHQSNVPAIKTVPQKEIA